MIDKIPSKPALLIMKLIIKDRILETVDQGSLAHIKDILQTWSEENPQLRRKSP